MAPEEAAKLDHAQVVAVRPKQDVVLKPVKKVFSPRREFSPFLSCLYTSYLFVLCCMSYVLCLVCMSSVFSCFLFCFLGSIFKAHIDRRFFPSNQFSKRRSTVFFLGRGLELRLYFG